MRSTDQSVLHELEALCTQEQPPACMSQCPLHVDGRGICAAITAGDYDSAVMIYEKTVPFPELLSQTCPEPCKAFCRRKEKGDGIQMRGLELAACEWGNTKKKRIFLPKRTDKAAIAGGGLSGLTAAIELGKKGCRVTVFEKSEKLGGRLLKLGIPEEVLEREFLKLKEYPIEIRLGEKIREPECLLEQYDVVYVAWGDENPPIQSDADTYESEITGIFAGGYKIRRQEYDTVNAIADGKRAAVSIDRFLKKVSMMAGREKEAPFETSLYVNLSEAEDMPLNAYPPFSKEEAAKEAMRCLDCKCLECVKGCVFLQEYKTFPRKYIREVYNNLSIAMGTRHANRMINSCSLCGQCKALCPFGLDVAALTKDARQLMVEHKKMPASSFEFALRDLEYSNSEEVSLLRHQPGMSTSSYLFFPGCQLGASVPELVLQVYKDLMQHLEGGVGLYLGCCGITADWAGERAIFEQTLGQLKKNWEAVGKPQVIVACPTCYQTWKSELPDVKLLGIWELFDREDAFAKRLFSFKSDENKKMVVKDACGARKLEGTRGQIRSLIGKLGYEIVPQKYENETAGCCGFGGLASVSNRELADKMAQTQVGADENLYLTYCMNCRDRYTKTGAKAMHLLELIYQPESICSHEVPTWSKRQDNRQYLKTKLLEILWEEEPEREGEMKLYYKEEMKHILEARMILENDIREVIADAEESQRKIWDMKKNCAIAGKQIGNVHFWVYYREKDDGFELLNAYSHRMSFR